MSLYIYAKTGHNYGLDDLKKCAYIYKELEEYKPILLVSDYRACAYANEYLNIKGATSIDVVQNIANVAINGDSLIICSDELNSALLEDMAKFFKTIVVIDNPIIDLPNIFYINSLNIQTQYYNNIDTFKSDIPVLFFGDDDYNKQLKSLPIKNKKVKLLKGYYFFMGYDEEIKNNFLDIIDEEEYFNTIKNSKYLITSSIYSCLESLYHNNKPIFIKRDDKIYNDEHILKQYNIPIYSFNELSNILNNPNDIFINYPNIILKPITPPTNIAKFLKIFKK